MWKIIFVFILVMPSFVVAQTKCPKYSSMLSKGVQSLNSNDPAKAFEFFRNAQIEGKLCHLKSTSEADEGIKKSFEALNELKRRAEGAEALANKNAAKALREKKNALKTSDSLRQAQKIIQTTLPKKTKYSSIEAQRFASVGIDIFAFQEVSIDSNIHGHSLISDNIIVNDSVRSNYESNLDFYLRAKRVSDSLNVLSRSKNHSFSNTLDDEAFIISVTNRLELDYYNNKVARSLRDSAKIELSKLNQEAENFDLLVHVYLRATLYYSWRLTSQKQFEEAKKALDEATEFVESNTKKSALFFYSLSGIQNAYNNYYARSGQNEKAYKYIIKSIENISRAVSMNPNNSLYQKGLSVYLRNATFTPDSILSSDDKIALAKLGCQCAKGVVAYFPKSGISLDALVTCTLDETKENIANGRLVEAINLLKSRLATVNSQVNYTPEKKNVYLQKARLQVKLSDTYLRHFNDTVSCKSHLDSTVVSWIEVFRNETDPIRSFDQVESVYDGIAGILNLLNQRSVKKEVNENLITATSRFSNYYLEQKSIQYVISLANKNVGEILEASKTKPDSLKALGYFIKSIHAIEKGDFLSSYSNFSEDIASFCIPYSESIKIYLNNGGYKQASEVYDKMISKFSVYYKKYPFDIYLIFKLKNASSRFGEYLYNSGQFEKAIPALELASYEGDKSSSRKLIEIYGNSNPTLLDTTALHLIQTRIGYQRDGMKKFTIPTQFGKEKLPFDVYVIDRDPLHAYKGIEDQVEWVRRARGGEIPTEVRESFLKLQALAWKNNVSFGELSVYALDAANEEKIIQKYEPLKDSIDQTIDEKEKLSYYQKLYSSYEYDIKNSKENVRVITREAVVFYNQYAKYQIKINQVISAQQIIKRVYELDGENRGAYENERRIEYVQNKDKVLRQSSKCSISDLKLYLTFCLEDLDLKNAANLTQVILEKNDNIETRENISELYYSNVGYSNFKELFLSDTSKLTSYWLHFNGKDISEIESNEEKRNFYFNLVEMDQALMEINTAEIVRTRLASHYNSLAWYCLLTEHYDEILYYLYKSVEFDSTSLFPYSNFPHAYLFTNDFERAKVLYLEFKDKPFYAEAGYPTYKDAFLSDFEEFEKAGLMNENMEKIIQLLNN